TGGDVTLDDANFVLTFAADNGTAGRGVTLNGTQPLTVGDVGADGTFAAVSGITSSGAGSVVRLQATGPIGQTATGVIQAQRLGVRNTGSGDIRLDQANVVAVFAAAGGLGLGSINFRTTTAL